MEINNYNKTLIKLQTLRLFCPHWENVGLTLLLQIFGADVCDHKLAKKKEIHEGLITEGGVIKQSPNLILLGFQFLLNHALDVQ